MMLVAHEDIVGGASTIYDNAESPVLTHTLAEPGDYIFIDDRTGMHSVSPVRSACRPPRATGTCSSWNSADRQGLLESGVMPRAPSPSRPSE